MQHDAYDDDDDDDDEDNDDDCKNDDRVDGVYDGNNIASHWKPTIKNAKQ